MLYDVQVNIPGFRQVVHGESTKIQAQNIFESHLTDGVAFTMTVKAHVHEHLWHAGNNYSDGRVGFTCDGCEEVFKISQTLLNACFAGGEIAREHGF